MKTKMKVIKNVGLFAVSAALLIGCTACNNGGSNGSGDQDGSKYTDPNTVVQTYDNKAYNEYLLGEGKSAIANQWGGYGIGDPFVMRWNGVYYLYVSSLDTQIGVRGYKSADLVNWVPMTGEGLKTGYVSEDRVTAAAYAPEVYYFNGTFYMYTSPGGKGHYILTSSKPEGPFLPVTDNFGLSIDGSVLIDDDEQMYFTHATNGGITMLRMNSMTEMNTSSMPLLNETSIGGWTEGSYILKHNGIYYLTYTGNHVASDGYRIAYSTATDLSGNYRNAFTRAQNNPLVLETESDLKGIGHSSTVMGPDMDSYYLVYHYLNSSGGPNRSLGIDRLTFDGKMMSVSAKLEGSVKPALPAFYAASKDGEKFSTQGAFFLSNSSAPASFTAEYNLSGAEVSTYVFGYKDENNYSDVTVNLSEKEVTLNKTVNGTTTKVESGTLVNDFAADKLHTVRVASRDGKVDVLFDNMTKIDDAELTVSAGKIGYKSLAGEAEVGYTAFSTVAMGMSDEKEAKQADAFVGAANYLHDDVYTVGSNLGSSSKIETITEEDDMRFDGWSKLTLGAKGDHASYLVYNGKAGRYGLELVYPKSYGGKKIGIKIDGVDGGKVYRCTLPAVKSQNEYVKAIVGEFNLAEGARIVRLENVGDAIAFTAFRFTETSPIAPQYEASLTSYAESGVDYKAIWKIKKDAEGNAIGHYAKAGSRQLVYFGDNTITDFTLEVEMMLEGETSPGSTAGIVFHAKNYASSPHDSEKSITGYYVGANNSILSLMRYNYADDTNTLDASAPAKFASDVFYKIKIQMRGNNIKVWIGDGADPVFDVTDDWSFASGKVGLYTTGAAVVFRNLKISG